MLDDGNGVESLDFKSKLEELLDGLGKKRNNKNRVCKLEEALNTNFTRSYNPFGNSWPTAENGNL